MCVDMFYDGGLVSILGVHSKHRLGTHSELINCANESTHFYLSFISSVLFWLAHFGVNTTIQATKAIDQHG